MVRTNPDVFAEFSLVVATDVYDEEVLCLLDDICRRLEIPLIVAHAYGFIGYLRISSPEITSAYALV